jgi:hypothetical protein
MVRLDNNIFMGTESCIEPQTPGQIKKRRISRNKRVLQKKAKEEGDLRKRDPHLQHMCEQVPMDRIPETQQIPPAPANARSGHPETKDLVSEPKPSSN